jgi:hypothetical protein
MSRSIGVTRQARRARRLRRIRVTAVAGVARRVFLNRVQPGQRPRLMTGRARRHRDHGAGPVRIVARVAALRDLPVARLDLLRVAAAAGRLSDLSRMRLVALGTVAMAGRRRSMLLLVTGAARRDHAA